MSHNTFGHLFRVTTFGESHGPTIGCVVDGCPPGIPLEVADIQGYLDKRRLRAVALHDAAAEPRRGAIVSGVMPDDGDRPGAHDRHANRAPHRQRRSASKDYGEIREQYRPGHADYAYDANMASETIAAAVDRRHGRRRCASPPARSRERSSSPARAYGSAGPSFRLDRTVIDRAKWDDAEIDKNPFFCPDAMAAVEWATYLDGVRKRGSSVRSNRRSDRRGRAGGMGPRRSTRSSMPSSRAR